MGKLSDRRFACDGSWLRPARGQRDEAPVQGIRAKVFLQED